MKEWTDKERLAAIQKIMVATLEHMEGIFCPARINMVIALELCRDDAKVLNRHIADIEEAMKGK